MSTAITVTPLTPPMILGEGPHWDARDQSLLFIDHPGKNLHRYYPTSRRHQVLDIDGLKGSDGPTFCIPVEGTEDKYVVGLGHDLGLVRWSPSDPDKHRAAAKQLCSFDLEYPNNLLNDAKCDPQGRLWAGTNGLNSKENEPNVGALYRIDSDLKTKKWVEQIGISNGLAWSNDLRHFFYIDSTQQEVYLFDYDDKSGNIDNRRTLINFKAEMPHAEPDGMTIDNNGHLWIAFFNGGKVACVDPDAAKIIREVEVPSRLTTSCCWGGPDYSTLFVTSATRDMSPEDIKENPHSGKTFAITGLGPKGRPHTNFRIKDTIANNL